jgi:hypothetical protein
LVSEKDVVSEDIFHSTPVGGREKDAVIGKCHGTVLTDEVGMVEKYTVFFLMLIYFFLSFCMCNSLILHHFRVTCRLKKKKNVELAQCSRWPFQNTPFFLIAQS